MMENAFENNDAKTINRSKENIYDWLCPVSAWGHDPSLPIAAPRRWHVSSEFPRRVKDVWNLGRHAVGDWMPKEQDRLTANECKHKRVTSSWRQNSLIFSTVAVRQSGALWTIQTLVIFYGGEPSKAERASLKRRAERSISVSYDSDVDGAPPRDGADSSDSESETGPSNQPLNVSDVDAYMTALVDQWGLRWEAVLRMGVAYLDRQEFLAERKRGDDSEDQPGSKRVKS